MSRAFVLRHTAHTAKQVHVHVHVASISSMILRDKFTRASLSLFDMTLEAHEKLLPVVV